MSNFTSDDSTSMDIISIPDSDETYIVEDISDASSDGLTPAEDLKLQRKLEREREVELRKKLKLEARKLAEEQSLRLKKEKALKGMKLLLELSDKYSKFCDEKVFSDSAKVNPLREQNAAKRSRRSLKESEENKYADVSKFLKYFQGGSLRPYQLDGVTWMTVLFENGLNGILADEMGLGKTIQVIALICHLLERNTKGPYLILGPLSTLPNWKAEFERFAPKVPVVVFHGSQSERMAQYKEIKATYTIGNLTTMPVVITNYQTPLSEQNFLSKFDWQYIIIDEGHRLKNNETKLFKILRSLKSFNRLLLTGTPLHNNLGELWSLLNFLLPRVFDNVDTFASLLMLEDVQDETRLLEQEEKNNLISTLHKVLTPFVLRRLKKDVLLDLVPKKEITVFCPLSKLQRELYSYVITKNLDKLKGNDQELQPDDSVEPARKKRRCTLNASKYSNAEDEADDSDFEDQLLKESEAEMAGKSVGHVEKKFFPYIVRLTMSNVVMMFKKIVNHPYLVHFPLDPNSEEKRLLIDENLVQVSGKMMVLDAMLPELKKRGHKVLIFSTLVIMLDFIEDFMVLRNHSYRRLDGGDKLQNRGASISEFNSDPNVFAFLISTRAGGLGVNLTGADTVIFFDNDWNPQVDIQAQDRCHRIGQTRPVMVYTLVTKNTIDEQIVTRAKHKKVLEKIVIKDDQFKINSRHRVTFRNELEDLQKLLEEENNNASNKHVFSSEELDKLLDRSELYDIMEKRKVSV